MQAIGLFEDTKSCKNKVIEVGPTVNMSKREFLRMRIELATEITIAEREAKKTFMHIVYNGPAEIYHNNSGVHQYNEWWNTILVPLKGD